MTAADPHPASGRPVVLRPQRALFALCPPAVWPYARFEVTGAEHIPATGPAVLAGNHRSYFDIPTMIQMMRHTSRTGRILAKRELFDLPVIGRAAHALGGIPVDRASGSVESLDAATRALERGEIVCLLPQGTIPRGERFFDPLLKGRTGAARLAAATGAPVVPFGIWGSEQVWPRSSRLPRMHRLSRPPTVRVRVGPPLRLDGASPVADTQRIMAAIVGLLPPEARVERVPTEAEIALATPRSRRRRHP
ncbi:1-acyl-sn-glycerol-3-phosphate acyltransferase [Phycicoccus sp. CSK15P-2]|uniref:lysophospholipid acyltransferase family protein n=1 Tax=Phycicoccus sp. CSK15P-2 TaxID=2807627 RepID=UPI00194EBF9D|nr:lysophospholipid acyltransferase family protein [Phycicoccus sp. CSK15P-2]MBM6403424.1 1-acyl-sn-glycerol-3-phosphate acyltransferase [Phycicoccus sp. CSK15P-2]